MSEKDEGTLKKEVILTGFGGQGIILAGRILGSAAVIGDHRNSTLVQAYGPEARGGACSAQVVISDGDIHYPYIREPDILVCLSQSGYDKFIGQLKTEGVLLIDQDLVQAKGAPVEAFAIASTRMAEELGRVMMANIIMIGFLSAMTGVVTVEAARNTVIESVPKGTEEMNTKAFNKGCDYGLAILKGREKKTGRKAGA